MSGSRFDFVIVGGGASGLSLALQLLRSPLGDRPIAIVDRDWSSGSNRTWAFWADRPTALDRVVSHSWGRLRIVTPSMNLTKDLHRYRYAMISGSDLRAHALDALTARPNVTIADGCIERVSDEGSSAIAVTNDREFVGQWVFDSRYTREHAGLRQSFVGWHVQTQRPVFDPEVPTLMDFRPRQTSGSCFAYTLPISEREALVEHVCCGVHASQSAAQRAALAAYLEDGDSFTIVREESGCTPLTARRFPRRTGRRVMTIGMPGGRVKPSTGYAFARIQRDSAAIVNSLVRTGEPFNVAEDSWRHRRYDRALLDLLRTRPEQVRQILSALFARNPLDSVLRFLDEASSPLEEARLAATLSAWFWLTALAPVGGSDV